METNKPYPPIIVFANEYFKVNAKVKAKLLKKHIETKEEKLIPKPVAATKGNKSKQKDSFGKPMFSKSEDASDSDESDTEFQTKLDVTETGEDSPLPKVKKTKKLKRKVDKSDEAEIRIKKKKTKMPVNNTVDIDDQLVDFELSD
jgi:hypothetical protein